MRLDGRDVMFLTGTDEHGQKVDKSARAAGVDPQSFCDRVSQNFRDMARLMNASNDDFIRTTEPRHMRASQVLVAGARAPRRDLSRQVRGLVLRARRGVLRRERTRQRQGPDRRRCRMGGGGKLFLPPVGVAGPPARALRALPRVHRPAGAPQRGRELRQGRAQRPLDLAHQLHLGRAGAGQSPSM